MHRYCVYGLALHSEVALPELASAPETPVDVAIRYGRVALGEPPDPGSKSWVETDVDPSRITSVFEGVGRFEVQAGATIVVDAEPEVDARLVRHALLGPVLAQVLWQRDVYTLHASVVRIDARHAAFVGVSGEGKSTTAAALTSRGHALVCDDVAAVLWRDDPVRVLPGFARIRLYDDSLRSLGADPDVHPRVHSLIDKRLTKVNRFVSEPSALDKVYVLETASELRAELLPARVAMLELMKHAYNAHEFAPIVGFERHMQMAARVSRAVPVYRLSRPKDLTLLPDLISFVESHLQT